MKCSNQVKARKKMAQLITYPLRYRVLSYAGILYDYQC
jgi:hypothetical protein